MESLYGDYRKAGGLGEAVKLTGKVDTRRVASAFSATVEQTKKLRGDGPFHPSRTRKSIRAIHEGPRRDPRERYPRGHELAADMWRQRHWDVADRPDLSFYYLDREIIPARTEKAGKGVIESKVISADLLLVNASPDDWTPIVGEIKVRKDENPMLALVQVLTAAAQLSTKRQRKRVRDNYSDFFGKSAVDLLDVYVVSYSPSKKGKLLDLYKSAVALAGEIHETGSLNQWIRNIEFLEARAEDGQLTFHVADLDSD